MRGQTRTIIIVIFSLVMLGVVVAIFAIRVWPMIRYGPFSPCWSAAVSKLGELTLLPWEKERQETFEFGDCVYKLYITNKPPRFEDCWLADYCESEGESYLFLIPIVPKEERGILKRLKIWEWPPEKLKKWWQVDLGGIKAVCKVLDKPLCGEEMNLTPGIYCIRVEKKPDCYNFTVKEGRCEK